MHAFSSGWHRYTKSFYYGVQYHADHDKFTGNSVARIDIEQNVEFKIRESRTRESVVIT